MVKGEIKSSLPGHRLTYSDIIHLHNYYVFNTPCTINAICSTHKLWMLMLVKKCGLVHPLHDKTS